jgi:hypothetical protein
MIHTHVICIFEYFVKSHKLIVDLRSYEEDSKCDLLTAGISIIYLNLI